MDGEGHPKGDQALKLIVDPCWMAIVDEMRIPSDADQRSEVMAIAIPK